MEYLTLNKEVLMMAILSLKDDAYPVSIREKVIDMTKKDVVYGTLYNSLEYLQKKGFINSRRGEPTSVRGGKSKIYFKLTDEGIEALKQTVEFQKSIIKVIEEHASDISGAY